MDGPHQSLNQAAFQEFISCLDRLQKSFIFCSRFVEFLKGQFRPDSATLGDDLVTHTTQLSVIFETHVHDAVRIGQQLHRRHGGSAAFTPGIITYLHDLYPEAGNGTNNGNIDRPKLSA